MFDVCTSVTRHISIRYPNSCHTRVNMSTAIFSLHILASPSGRNMNYDNKQLSVEIIFELFLLSVQVSLICFAVITFVIPQCSMKRPVFGGIKWCGGKQFKTGLNDILYISENNNHTNVTRTVIAVWYRCKMFV
jgi:hypothetical protein